MGFLGSASGLSKVSCLLLWLAFGIHCVGYATTSWVKYEAITESQHYVVGLWRMDNCSGYHGAPCIEGPIPDSLSTSLLVVTAALESCCLIGLFITAVMIGFYVASPAVRVQKMAVAILVMCFLSALFSVGGLTSFRMNLPEKHYPFWSLGLTLIATGLAIMAAIFMIPDIRSYDYQKIKFQMRRAKRKIKKKLRAERKSKEKDTKF